MPCRIWIVLLTVFCGLPTLAPPAAAQEKKVQITYSLVGDATLKSGTATIVNKGQYKNKAGIVIGIPKKSRIVDLDAVDQIVFQNDMKKTDTDKLMLTNGKYIMDNIISSFEIKEDSITHTFTRKDLANIKFVPKKKAAIELPAEVSPVHVTHKFPPIFPFWDLPKVTMISGSYSECCKLSKQCTLEECARKENLFTWAYRFKTAVHFPQPRFNDAGDRHDTPGTGIYEGMQIVVASDGRYEVAFNATTPRIPVTLRLQLSVCVVGHEPIMVSLPAISMTPEYRDAESDYGGSNRVLSNNFQQNWHVRHIGFSPELASAVCLPGCLVVVQRDGVARFGSLPLSR